MVICLTQAKFILTIRIHFCSHFRTDAFTDDIDSTNLYAYIYTGLIVGVFLATFIRAQSFFSFCMNASTKLYNKSFDCVLRSPITFFYINPAGKFRLLVMRLVTDGNFGFLRKNTESFQSWHWNYRRLHSHDGIWITNCKLIQPNVFATTLFFLWIVNHRRSRHFGYWNHYRLEVHFSCCCLSLFDVGLLCRLLENCSRIKTTWGHW